ncbi:MAG: protein translocase subunit SecDF [Chitinophagales bacterium]
MQGKGLIQFFLIVLTIVCLYQLSFTWKANSIEKAATEYAEKTVPADVQGEAREEALLEQRGEYLTEQSNKTVYNLGIAKYNYTEVKERAINLGLDLQGGMSVVLEVSKYDLLKGLVKNPKDVTFITALDKARVEEGKGNGELIDNFGKFYEEANPGAKLITLVNLNEVDPEQLSITSTNGDVLAYMKDQAISGFNATFTKLQQRIDKFGVAAPYITKLESSNRILIELPGVDNPKNVRNLLQSTANLQFWDTYQVGELNFEEADRLVRALLDGAEAIDTSNATISKTDTSITGSNDVASEPVIDTNEVITSLISEDTSNSDTSLISEDTTAQNAETGPLMKLLTLSGGGPVLALVNKVDTAELMEYLNLPEVSEVFGNAKFMLSADAAVDPTTKEKTDSYELYAMKPKAGSDEPLLEGDIIRNAAQTYNQMNGAVEVTMSMKSEGARQWSRITGENVGKYIAVVLDNQVYSAPRINEKIPGGSSIISGNFDVKDAQVLANILETGKLPVPSRIVQEDIVGPSLGADSIRVGVISLIVGLLLVILFTAVYYSTAGVVADLALFGNIFFIFGVLASLGATLTLPGIAGLVLTMGMAVDANVIIFERIKEELAKGKSMLKAIADGYSGSYSAIIDGNLTTLIIAFILASTGSGPVKGFAVVLIVGILSSLFCSIFISRLVIDWQARKERPVKYYTFLTKNAFKNINFDWMGKRRIAYMFSAAVTVIGLILILTTGFDLGVDFKGGRTYTVQFDQPVDADAVRDHLSKNFDDKIQVKTFSGDNKLKITTSNRVDENLPETDSLVAYELYNNLSGFYTSKLDFDTWDNTQKLGQMKVEPTVAKDIQIDAYKSIAIALLAIFIYIVVRFRRWQFGLGAVISLMHDAFMVISLFAILKNIMPFSLEVNEAFIAAVLTVIGYSINDTCVVFDRIREFLRESRSGTITKTFNSAINQTLSRTIITSGTTLLSIVVLLIFGNENIQGFAFALFIGIGFGTYSSIFIASAIALDAYKKEDREKQADEVMKR